MQSTQEVIRACRGADVTVSVINRAGKPRPGIEVTVSQVRHQFGFGANGHPAIGLANDECAGQAQDHAKRYLEQLIELCNTVTLPFYWGQFEPKQGEPRTRKLLNAANWFNQRRVAVKGHPLCWHTACANWLLDMPTGQIIDTQLNRIRREVSAFSGVINTWDVINEVVIMPNFDKYDNGITRMCRQLGRIGMVRETFRAARESNPAATLVLNDFDMSAAYECLIEGVLEAGIQIDVLGLQSHMHQGYWGVEKTLDVLKRFSRYGIPIHFTELNILSGQPMPADLVDLNDYQVDQWPSTPDGEARQAEQAVEFYTTLLADPAVQAITWWDFTDGGWLKAPVGLLREDRSPKPAYNALHQLIKRDWWLSPTRFVTDRTGQVHFNGFLGDYQLSTESENTDFKVDRNQNCLVTVIVD